MRVPLRVPPSRRLPPAPSSAATRLRILVALGATTLLTAAAAVRVGIAMPGAYGVVTAVVLVRDVTPARRLMVVSERFRVCPEAGAPARVLLATAPALEQAVRARVGPEFDIYRTLHTHARAADATALRRRLLAGAGERASVTLGYHEDDAACR